MESDWQVISQRLVGPSPSWDSPARATALSFDTHQELLWVGDQHGRVQSYLGSDHSGMSLEMSDYTAYAYHRRPSDHSYLRHDPSVLQITPHSSGIFSLSAFDLIFARRSGLPIWHLDHSVHNGIFRCMSIPSDRNHILLAGVDRPIDILDIETQQLISTLQLENAHNPTHIKQAQTTCVASEDGSISFFDNTSLTFVSSWKAFSGPISDFDVKGNYVITCGQSLQPFGLNQTANLYDLRMHRHLAPIPVIAGAAFVRMHPRMSSTAVIAAHNGQMQTVDLSSSAASNFKHANINSYITCMDLASSGDALALADADQPGPTVQLWGSLNKLPHRFVERPEPITFANMSVPILPKLSWHPTRTVSPPLPVSPPLNSIGLSPYSERNLNYLGDIDAVDFSLLPPEKIDDSIMANAQFNSQAGYAPNPKTTRRNQRQAYPTNKLILTSNSQTPRFLSQQARKPYGKDPAVLRDPSPEVMSSDSESDFNESSLPMIYRKHIIKYSKFGVDDFDFTYYNATDYSGLEGDISNCYVNSYLQLLKFTPSLRNLCLSHAAGRCYAPLCMLCESGFVCDNLEKASHLAGETEKSRNKTSQASNFVSAFAAYPSVDSRHITEANLVQGYGQTIQRFSHFLLEAFAQEAYNVPNQAARVHESLTLRAVEEKRCQQCNAGSVNEVQALTTELVYVRPPPHAQYSQHPAKFAEVLQQSLERDIESRGWCSGQCHTYRPIRCRRAIQQLPDVLTLHVNALKAMPDFWAMPHWLPDRVGIVIDQGTIHCFQGVDLDNVRAAGSRNLFVFRLVGMVAEIKEPDSTHLVSLVDTGAQTRADPSWHLFNDFLVRKCSKDAALAFPAWKRPAVLTYQLDKPMLVIDNTWADRLDTGILRIGFNQAILQGRLDYAPLNDAETPKRGTRVSLDAEFVVLQAAETETKAGGTSETIRPAKAGVARISVCRAEGLNEGKPFIDDFVLPSAAEPIVDYVTQYSGITAADLDPTSSTKNLVPPKLAYKRIWTLANLGCAFVGHGLRNDFRKININVPAQQTFDTQKLLYLEHHRFLSLKYLAWECLGTIVQAGEGTSGHSSVEDAATAGLLFRKWEEYSDAGVLEARLQEIYEEGTALGWKPPATEEDGREQMRLRKRRSRELVEAQKKRRSSPEDFAKRWRECTGGEAVLASGEGTADEAEARK